MSRFVSSVLFFMITGSAVSRAQLQNTAGPSAREPEITAGGRGEVRLSPDYAYVVVGVTTQSPSAVQTASQNAAKVSAIVSALHALGLTDQQIVTAGYNLTQTYEYPKNQPPRMNGFTARNTVRAEVRRLDDIGKVIDAAINAGATDVSSIQFLASTTDEARRNALSAAVQQARSDADVMARAAGGRLGRLIAVNSSGVSQPITVRGASLESVVATGASGYTGPPTPINPGELNVTAYVFTRWEFLPGGAR
jgi:uncharacterized protein